MYFMIFFHNIIKSKGERDLSGAMGRDLLGVPTTVSGVAGAGSQDPDAQPCALPTAAARVCMHS